MNIRNFKFKPPLCHTTPPTGAAGANVRSISSGFKYLSTEIQKLVRVFRDARNHTEQSEVGVLTTLKSTGTVEPCTPGTGELGKRSHSPRPPNLLHCHESGFLDSSVIFRWPDQMKSRKGEAIKKMRALLFGCTCVLD